MIACSPLFKTNPLRQIFSLLICPLGRSRSPMLYRYLTGPAFLSLGGQNARGTIYVQYEPKRFNAHFQLYLKCLNSQKIFDKAGDFQIVCKTTAFRRTRFIHLWFRMQDMSPHGSSNPVHKT